MREPGEPIESADYAFTFRGVEPATPPARALLVLLHGVGGDECQLADWASRVPADVAVALPRGIRTISGERLGWFRVGLGADEPQVVEHEAEEARVRLVDFIAQMQARFDVPPSRTLVGGFSQGGVLAATAALTAPAGVAGFAMVSGRLMPEYNDRIAPPEALRHLRALVLHGSSDDVLPVADAQEAAKRLETLGIDCRLRLHDAGHERVPAMADDLAAWWPTALAAAPG